VSLYLKKRCVHVFIKILVYVCAVRIGSAYKERNECVLEH
jgi:hypothetical protein